MLLGINTLEEFGGLFNSYSQDNLDEYSIIKMIRDLHDEFDIDVIEINANINAMRPELFTKNTFNSLADFQKKTGVRFTVHLPFRNIDISSLSESIRKASVEYCKKLMLKYESYLEVEHYVLHLFGHMMDDVFNFNHNRATKYKIIDEMMSKATKSINNLSGHFCLEKIAIENLEYYYERTYKIAKNTGASICCDIGHLAIEGADITKVIKEYFDDIIHIHFHDVLKHSEGGEISYEDHVALNSGIINAQDIIDLLLKLNYQDVLLIEVKNKEHIRKSMRMINSFNNGG